MKFAVRAVLFDLDGTLADTAPDLGGAVNRMRVRRGLLPLAIAALRPVASSGARGMLGLGLGIAPREPGYEAVRDEFLAEYESALVEKSRLFDGMAECLEGLRERGLPWGIVTNKAERFTRPVVEGLRLHTRAAVVICGDTTPHSKPHPAPLQEAARRVGVEAALCVYIGDDKRDVEAGHAAGMLTLAAAWGYLGQGEPIDAWGAHAVLAEPGALLHWLELA